VKRASRQLWQEGRAGVPARKAGLSQTVMAVEQNRACLTPGGLWRSGPLDPVPFSGGSGPDKS